MLIISHYFFDVVELLTARFTYTHFQEDEGICTSKLFTEQGMIDLLEEASEFFREAHLYEAVSEV